VVGLDFHPQEYTLAVGAADATATFWEMENIVALGSTPRESQSLRCISFSKDGRALLAATSDALRSWAFDPEVVLNDAMEVGWGGGGAAGGSGASAAAAGGQQVLADMAEGDVPGQELIGVTRCRNVIGVFICELASLKPFDVPMDLSDDASAYNTAAADNGASLMATLERVPYAENRAPAPADLIVRGGSAAGSSSVEENFSPTAASAAAAAIPAHSPAGSASATPPVTRQQPNTNFFDAHAAGGGVQIAVPTKPRPQPQPAAAPAQPYVAPQAAAPANAGPSGVAAAAPSSRHQRDGSNGLTAAASASASSIAIDPRQLPPSKFVTPAATAAAPAASSGAVAAASSSDSAASSAAATEAAAAALAAARRKVESDHPQVLQILQDRAARLRELATLWQSSGGSLGGAKRCVESLASRPDNAVTHDFLMFVEPVLIVRGNSGAGVNLTLDVARDLLPLLIKLLAQQPRYQNYIELALRYVRMLLVQFTPVIQSQFPGRRKQPHAAVVYFFCDHRLTVLVLFFCCLLLGSGSRASALSGVGVGGVDVTRDERLARAQDCFAHFKTVYDHHIAAVAKKNNAVGELAKDTRAHLEKLLFSKV
jgi:hypothetical protein